jgi:hypothetical protein
MMEPGDVVESEASGVRGESVLPGTLLMCYGDSGRPTEGWITCRDSWKTMKRLEKQ